MKIIPLITSEMSPDFSHLPQIYDGNIFSFDDLINFPNEMIIDIILDNLQFIPPKPEETVEIKPEEIVKTEKIDDSGILNDNH